MFALIETKGATHIAIHLPAEKLAASSAALANMLEHNATFIRSSWRDMEVVNPSMSIVLGNKYEVKDSDGEALIVSDDDSVIDDDFVIDSPDIYRSNNLYREKTEAELTTKRREIDSLKLQVEKLQSALAAATSSEEVEA
jgi:hypothetical protein